MNAGMNVREELQQGLCQTDARGLRQDYVEAAGRAFGSFATCGKMLGLPRAKIYFGDRLIGFDYEQTQVISMCH
jgi:hypothetical protein